MANHAPNIPAATEKGPLPLTVLWRRVRCGLGFHDFKMTDHNWRHGVSIMECSRCPQEEPLRASALTYFIRNNPARRRMSRTYALVFGSDAREHSSPRQVEPEGEKP